MIRDEVYEILFKGIPVKEIWLYPNAAKKLIESLPRNNPVDMVMGFPIMTSNNLPEGTMMVEFVDGSRQIVRFVKWEVTNA